MNEQTAKLPDLSAVKPTVDFASPYASGAEAAADMATPRDYWGRVAVAAGSGTQLTRETLSLLRTRLQLAAALMFLGFLVFLPLHFFQTDFSLPGSAFVFAFHGVGVVVSGVLGGLLCRRQIPLVQLRLAELAVFGTSAAFLVALQHFSIIRQCHDLALINQMAHCEEARLALPGALWLLLLFMYALFIPNTWRRAAVVIGVLAATPVVAIFATILSYDVVRQSVAAGDVAGFALTMAVAAVAGLFGVDTIGTLRREAFEARQLGQYRLTKRIGAGGMGEVYLAEHQMLKRPCAIKLIHPGKAADPNVLARFQREVRATAKLSHWNTVEIFDYGNTQDGTFYYVMEYLPGMSLTELVERFGPLPPERVIHFLRQVCDALSEAHAAGLIHRDIKPGNIFAAQRGGVYDVAKLLDFGLVKPPADETPLQLTVEGAIAGTPWFMSPEQATGDGEPDARCDIFSLGAVGYYLLTARPPFEGDKPIKVMIALAHDEVVPPSRHRREVPADLEQVILRCLAKAPADRFQDAAGLAKALAECQAAGRWTRGRAADWWHRHPANPHGP